MNNFHLHSLLCTYRAHLNNPPSPCLSRWRMDVGECQLKWNPICGVEWGHRETHKPQFQRPLRPGDGLIHTLGLKCAMHQTDNVITDCTPSKTSTWLIRINYWNAMCWLIYHLEISESIIKMWPAVPLLLFFRLCFEAMCLISMLWFVSFPWITS